MVLNGTVNTRILAACRDLHLPAVGISGVDAGLIKAHKRPPVQVEGHAGGPVDFGFVGDIDSVDTDVVRTQLENGMVPIVSPLSADENGTVLNINADTVAAALATSLRASKLILSMGAPGILEHRHDPSSLVSYLDLEDLQGTARQRLPRPRACCRRPGPSRPRSRAACAAVHLISYKMPDSLLLEIFTNEGTGTLVVEDTDTLTPEEQEAGA